MASFSVAEHPVEVNGRWEVVGRCSTDIAVGDVFTKSTTWFLSHDDPDGEKRVYSHHEPVPIFLKIEEIIAYGKSWTEWSKGMSAKLILSGDGKTLEKSMVLESDEDTVNLSALKDRASETNGRLTTSSSHHFCH